MAGLPNREVDTARPRESFSELVARILDQLSLSAWLPAAAVVFSTLFLVNVRHAEGQISGALESIGAFNVPDVVLIIVAIVVGTVFTQAFEFEAIRFLEGYWGPRRVVSFVADLRCRHHIKTRDRLGRRLEDETKRAVESARSVILAPDPPLIERRLVDIIEANALGYPLDAPDDEIAAAVPVPWEQYADPSAVRRMEDLGTRVLNYPPEDHRVLPTKLGNTLRAHEARATATSSGNLEGWVMRRFHRLPGGLQVAHDQHRTRLDLYCSMVFVSAVMGAAGLALLWKFGWAHRLFVVAVAFAVGWLLYRAAVASARAYGTVLETIAAWEAIEVAGAATTSEPSPEPLRRRVRGTLAGSWRAASDRIAAWRRRRAAPGA